MSLRQRLARLFSGGFARAVGVLVGGTALGNAITAAAMPALTRLYTPAEFGLLAVFSSLVGIASVAACLRYEIAITMPESESVAAHLVAVSAAAALVVGAVLAAVAAAAAAPIAQRLGQPLLAPLLWLVPLYTLLAGLFAALQYWALRQRRFGSLARTRVTQAAAASGTQIAAGLAGLGALGLLLGPVVNVAAGVLGTLLPALRHDRRVLAAVDAATMRQVARSHARFPLYSTPEALANSASIQLPVMLIAALGSSAEAGHLMLAMFVVQAPMSLLGNAVSQVYLARAPAESREGTLGRFTAEVIGGLLRTGVGPLLALGIVAPFVFAPVFGPAWERAGVVVSWLTPWFVAHLLTAPVSMALHVHGRQRQALALQLGGLALRVGSVLVAAYALEGGLSEAYALSGLLFYAVYLFVVARVAGCRGAELARALRAALRPCALWSAAGAALAGLASAWVGA